MATDLSYSSSSSYWCYRCSRLVRIHDSSAVVCPDCHGGFLEAVASPPPIHSRRRPGERNASFNPVIVLRGPHPSDSGGGNFTLPSPSPAPNSAFELYYDDGVGSGLRPLPASMSEFLMGSGFERLLDQLAQIEASAGRSVQCGRHTSASKSSVESMPTVEIDDVHVSSDSHCAVCMDPFEIGSEAREMPCKHIYHSDCILPWLSMRKSCPVCRHEMPADETAAATDGGDGENDGSVGLTVWRLPGGGYAVGRFAGGGVPGRGGPGSDRDLPVVFTEMDGGFNSGGVPRRVTWASGGLLSNGRRRRSRSSDGSFGRFFRNFTSLFWRSGSGGGASPNVPERRLRMRN